VEVNHTYNYVLATGHELDRLGSVRLLHGLVQRKFIARLNLTRCKESSDVCMGGLGGACGEVGVDTSHIRMISFFLYVDFGTSSVGRTEISGVRKGGVQRNDSQMRQRYRTGTSKSKKKRIACSAPFLSLAPNILLFLGFGSLGHVRSQRCDFRDFPPSCVMNDITHDPRTVKIAAVLYCHCHTYTVYQANNLPITSSFSLQHFFHKNVHPYS
jgi:hypothetical protein